MKLSIITQSYLKPKVINTLFALSLGGYYVTTQPPLPIRLAFHFSLPHLMIQNLESQNLQPLQNYKSPLTIRSQTTSFEQTLGRAPIEKEIAEGGINRKALIENVLQRNSVLHLEIKSKPLIVSQRAFTLQAKTAETAVPVKTIPTEAPVLDHITFFSQPLPVETIVATETTVVEPHMRAIPIVEVVVPPQQLVPCEPVTHIPQENARDNLNHPANTTSMPQTPPFEEAAPQQKTTPGEPEANIPEENASEKFNHHPQNPIPNNTSIPQTPPFEEAAPHPKTAPGEPNVNIPQVNPQDNFNQKPQKPVPIHSTTPGKIIEILVKEGDTVLRGQPLFRIDFMKMKIPIFANVDGVIGKIHLKLGDTIEPDQPFAEVNPTPAPANHSKAEYPEDKNEPFMPKKETFPQEPMNPILTKFLALLEPNSAFSQDENEIRKALKKTLLLPRFKDHVNEDWVGNHTTEWRIRRSRFFNAFERNINTSKLSFSMYAPRMNCYDYTPTAEEFLIDLPNQIVKRGGLTLFNEDEVHAFPGL